MRFTSDVQSSNTPLPKAILVDGVLVTIAYHTIDLHVLPMLCPNWKEKKVGGGGTPVITLYCCATDDTGIESHLKPILDPLHMLSQDVLS